jgi:seryl-tRNA(Sec) selenium transferase
MHDLIEAKKALQEFGKRADLDAVAKTKLTVIADALGEAEQRLKALEEVVEELATGAKLETVRSDSYYVAKLLGRHRG